MSEHLPIGDAVDPDPTRPRRHVGPIPERILREIANDDWAHNRKPVPDQPTLREAAILAATGFILAALVGAAIAYAQSQGWIAR